LIQLVVVLATINHFPLPPVHRAFNDPRFEVKPSGIFTI
jgi:hypothetical protein